MSKLNQLLRKLSVEDFNAIYDDAYENRERTREALQDAKAEGEGSYQPEEYAHETAVAEFLAILSVYEGKLTEDGGSEFY